ncbi:MAG TPA: hypothetical protein VKC60_13525 [Opitutaceae bacterium]|nr:hypothetical protein [Opitutaceae bacterium]
MKTQKHGKLKVGAQAAGLPQNLQAGGLRSQKSIPDFLASCFVYPFYSLLDSRYSPLSSRHSRNTHLCRE